MLLFTGASAFSETLLDTFQSLVNDPNIIVRRTISCGLHEVIVQFLFAFRPIE